MTTDVSTGGDPRSPRESTTGCERRRSRQVIGDRLAIDDAIWDRAIGLVDRADSIVLTCHVSPDGDALGSLLAMAQALRSRGATVWATWGDEPWRRPAAWDWLPGMAGTTSPGEVPRDPDVLVVLDTGASDRLGVLAPLVHSARAVVVLDHHGHGSDIAASTDTVDAAPVVRCVDPGAAATASVVEEFLRRLGCPLTPPLATCLYAGLVTDTGSFRHAVTTPPVHRLAARLLEAGVRPDDVGRRIWGTQPFGTLPLLAAALARVRLERAAVHGRGLVWTWVEAHELASNGLAIEDADVVMETIRVAAEADVAVVLKGDTDGSYKASTRSRGATDVGAACAALGGGGHRLAAGFTARGEPDGILADFVALLI